MSTPTLVIPWLREGYKKGLAMCHPMSDLEMLDELANFLESDLMPVLPNDQLLLLGTVPHTPCCTPVIMSNGMRHQVVMVADHPGNWRASVKITNGKPPVHSRLHQLLKDAAPKEEDGTIDNPMPVEWQFPSFDDSKTEFTVWLAGAYWLFAFLDQLKYELSQY